MDKNVEAPKEVKTETVKKPAAKQPAPKKTVKKSKTVVLY